LKVAPIFKVSTLQFWRDKAFSENVLKEAKDSIKNVYRFFFPYTKMSDNSVEPKTPDSSTSTNSTDAFFAKQFLFDQFHEEKENALASKDALIENEIQNFIQMKDDLKIMKKFTSSKNFWNCNRNKFPNLRKLALILLKISISSASIERYFIITGIICDKRNSNMNSLLLIWRGLLRANIEILSDINKKS